MKRPPEPPEKDATAHTELRPAGATKRKAARAPQPRTAPERLPKADEDGLDDMFNDMPV